MDINLMCRSKQSKSLSTWDLGTVLLLPTARLTVSGPSLRQDYFFYSFTHSFYTIHFLSQLTLPAHPPSAPGLLGTVMSISTVIICQKCTLLTLTPMTRLALLT